MRIDVLTLFPDMFSGPFGQSVIARTIKRGLLDVAVHNIRDFATSRHRTVDDYPYGGGAGMVMQPGPLFSAVESLSVDQRTPVILLTPRGDVFTQATARRLAREERFVLLCGHYEGVNERVHEGLATESLSIGDYVLSGGEIAAMVVVDAVARLLPGAIDEASIAEETHSDGLLEYPQYTRPASFRGMVVPDILLSGNHGAVARWRREESLRRTFEQRPDLLVGANLSPKERALVQRWQDARDQKDRPACAPNGDRANSPCQERHEAS